MQFNFKQTAGAFTGSVSMTMGEQKIVDGQIEGGTIKFETVMDFFGQERRILRSLPEGEWIAFTAQGIADSSDSGR